MYLIDLLVTMLLLTLIGLTLGCYVRLRERHIPFYMLPVVAFHFYYILIMFNKWAIKNKELLIETLASAGIEKGTENKKEIINEKKQELESVWSVKYVRGLHRDLLRSFFKETDVYIDVIFDNTEEIYLDNLKNTKIKRRNVAFFSGLVKELSEYIRAWCTTNRSYI